MTLSLGMTLLILLAAVMHAGWNVMIKFGNDAFLNMGLIVGLGGVLGLLVVVSQPVAAIKLKAAPDPVKNVRRAIAA